ncbi:MAG: CoA transferase [Dehalococcoidia bacterium]|nr:CoA transferase [Dehalococcoidia bacterium]
MASGPLNGIRILEFTQIIAGPLGCQLLADLGAEIIKIEPPEGEPWRLNQQFIPKESKVFMGLNRGKKSLAIDMAQPKAQEAIHRLVKDVDVVVINYRPDVAARLGIDYETLCAIRPDVIYMDNTAFGREGEWANRPGYDIAVQAASGLIAAVGKVDERGTPLVGPAHADTTTAYAIAAGVSAALYHRALTGEGQKVETSLLINALTIQMTAFADVPAADAEQRAGFQAALALARETGMPYAQFLEERQAILRRQAGGNVYYRCFLTRDGAIAMGALSTGLRSKVRATLGFEHNRDEPDYNALDPEQVKVDEAVREHVEALFLTKTSAEWEAILTKGGVPVAPITFIQELIDHPQVVANGYAVELDHEMAGPVRMQAPPWKMSKTPPAPQGPSPVLGRHSDEVLASAGYSSEEIASMRAEGVIL